jgi:hypothetical protein
MTSTKGKSELSLAQDDIYRREKRTLPHAQDDIYRKVKSKVKTETLYSLIITRRRFRG